MTERKILEKYDNLSENELNKKDKKKSLCQKWCYNQCYCELQKWKKKRKERKTGGFRKKLKILESAISENEGRKLKSKIGTIFASEKILDEYSVKIYEIDPYFYERF